MEVLKTQASLQNHVTVGTKRYRYWSPLIGQLSPFYKHVAVPVVVKGLMSRQGKGLTPRVGGGGGGSANRTSTPLFWEKPYKRVLNWRRQHPYTLHHPIYRHGRIRANKLVFVLTGKKKYKLPHQEEKKRHKTDRNDIAETENELEIGMTSFSFCFRVWIHGFVNSIYGSRCGRALKYGYDRIRNLLGTFYLGPTVCC